MTSLRWISTAAVVLAVAVAPAGGQSGSDLFQKALSKERVDGQFAEAIALYERVVKESAGDRALAAKALLQIARCYERLGNVEAQNTYDRIVREYPDQRAPAAAARARLRISRAPDSVGDGASTRRVWTDGANSVSPDGRYLSYTDWETGDLAVRDLAGGVNRRVTDKGPWHLSPGYAEFSVFSPDSHTIVYTWCGEGTCHLRTIARAGGTPRVLYRHEDVTYPQAFDWSSDGKQIVASFARPDRSHQLVVISALTGSVRVLKTFDWRMPWKVVFSPDGASVAYDFPPDPDAPERDVFVLAVDGSREVHLVDHPAHDVLLGWQPRTSRVYFASERTGTNAVWSVRADAAERRAEPELVKPGIGRILALNFTTPGDLYYELSTARTDVHLAGLDPATGELTASLQPVKTRFEQGKLAGVWSPSGDEIAYLVASTLVRGGMGGATLAIHALPSGQVRTIPLPLNYSNRLRWMPDGRAVVIGGSDLQGRRGLFRVELSSGRVEPIIYDRVGRFSITADAATLIYERRGETQSWIVTRDLRSGAERELYRTATGAAGVVLSPDGRSIAIKVNLAKSDGAASPFPTIQVAPAAGGDPRTLITLDEPDTTDWREMAWSPDGRFIYFTVRSGSLWRIAAAGGPPLRLVDNLASINSISIHPGGRQLAVSEGSARYETWAIENLAPGSSHAPLDLSRAPGARRR